MKIELWPIDRPIPYARNARRIPQAAVDKVAASIKGFGWRQPIVVDRHDVIIVGHARLLAAQKLGLTEVPVHVAANLTPEQVKAYRLMDNRSHQEAEWDLELLAPELSELQAMNADLLLTGFDQHEIASLLAKADAVEGLTDPDACPQLQPDPITIPGDLWALGRHRLLCGDSTNIDAVQRLMAGEKADMVFTDPPYNVDYDPEARHSTFSADRTANPLGRIKNDQKSPEDFRRFLDDVYTCIDVVLKAGRAIYVCHADTEGHHFRGAFVAQPWNLQSCIIWKKSVLCFGRADYHWIHEPILYGWKEGATHLWAGDRKQTTVWEFKTDHYNKDRVGHRRLRSPHAEAGRSHR
jgi:hypothetical protein